MTYFEMLANIAEELGITPEELEATFSVGDRQMFTKALGLDRGLDEDIEL